MELKKMQYDKVTPEMVDRLIDEHYVSVSESTELLLNQYAAYNKSEIDIEQIASDIIAYRESLVDNVNYYEDELIRMLDLATVLSDTIAERDFISKEMYINFLLEKNKEILPDIVELLQLLKK